MTSLWGILGRNTFILTDPDAIFSNIIFRYLMFLS